VIRIQDLSQDALAVLRLFIQSGARKAGQALSSESVSRRWRGSEASLGEGLNELVASGLVQSDDDPSVLAALTDAGECFVGQHTHSCY